MNVERLKKFACFITVLGLLANLAFAGASPRSREPFNSGWRFLKADPAGAEKLEFNDSSWRKLDLPHDWGVEGAFDQSLPGETAKLPYAGIGWYRKHFSASPNERGKQFYLDVDGAMSNAKVWLNGHKIGGWNYGYTSWRVDLTPYLRFDGVNVIAIRLDNPPDSSRWYPGGGIYRNVWLVKAGPLHILEDSLFIGTPDVRSNNAAIHIELSVTNQADSSRHIVVLNYILVPGQERSDADLKSRIKKSWLGTPLAPERHAQFKRARARLDEPAPYATLAPGASAKLADDFIVENPKFWSPEHPDLYRLVTRVVTSSDVTNRVAKGEIVDEIITPFGIRNIQFTPEQGFLLNGKVTEINGVCLHHDLGALGAAFNLRARERQLEKLKELGCNAIRTSHNPPEPELLDLCDRMGFLVMEEAFDAWRMAKRTNDYHVSFDAWAEKDLRAMIQRDRNHPSVILWSLGNEIYEQREGTNWPMADALRNIAHDEDPTRPVNMALHVVAASTNGFQNAVDVFGYNYTPHGYAQFRKDNPKIPLVGSETSSCVSSRGEYFFPVSENKKEGRADFQCTSYDLAAPSWAYAPDVEFKAQDENPFVAGEFVWTGFDYLGEPTPFDNDTTNRLKFTDPALRAKADEDLKTFGKIRVPSRSSYFGIFDLCGFPKDRFYLYQARWRPELPMAHILPHWNWPERVGQLVPVHVYTSGDAAELFLNGKSLGRKTRGPFEYRLRWDDVKYQPGELKVVAYKNGRKWATDVMKTTGPAVKLAMQADRTKIAVDGSDLSFITVTVADKDGLLVPRSKNLVRFSVEGPGEIVAADNGDATSFESFQSHERKAFNGLALVIVRAKSGQSGTMKLRAESDGLKSAVISISTHKPN